MGGDHFRSLFRLFWQPAAAMSDILDQGSLLFATLAVLAVSLVLQQSVTSAIWKTMPMPSRTTAPAAAHAEIGEEELPIQARLVTAFSFYSPLLLLAAIYVPGTAVIATLMGRLGGVGTVLSRDYTSLLTCTAMAFAAASLPPALAGLAGLSPRNFAILAALAGLYFSILMFFAVRTVFGTDNAISGATAALSWVVLAFGVFAWIPLSGILGILASPFFLFFAWYYLGGELANLGSGLRSRQNFRRMLEAAAVNPHDAEAQYQLGLVYQQRRQYSQAIGHFRKATEIDPRETDAHFQLGRIAREQGRLNDALASFQTVVDQNEKHSSSEILREIGAVYVAARQHEHARRELNEYVQRRPYDPEGLYYCGLALENLGDPHGAREVYARAVESDRSAPRFRRHLTAKWSRLAQKQLRKLR